MDAPITAAYCALCVASSTHPGPLRGRAHPCVTSLWPAPPRPPAYPWPPRRPVAPSPLPSSRAGGFPSPYTALAARRGRGGAQRPGPCGAHALSSTCGSIRDLGAPGVSPALATMHCTGRLRGGGPPGAPPPPPARSARTGGRRAAAAAGRRHAAASKHGVCAPARCPAEGTNAPTLPLIHASLVAAPARSGRRPPSVPLGSLHPAQLPRGLSPRPSASSPPSAPLISGDESMTDDAPVCPRTSSGGSLPPAAPPSRGGAAAHADSALASPGSNTPAAPHFPRMSPAPTAGRRRGPPRPRREPAPAGRGTHSHASLEHPSLASPECAPRAPGSCYVSAHSPF
jgi:hypothetical protein